MEIKDAYTQKSIDWDLKSGVRNNPETYELNLSVDLVNEDSKLSWHLPNYSGILNHPELKDLDDSKKEYIKGIQLLEFVSKQTIFEVDCVNYVAAKIAHGKYSFELDDQIKLDALKIYTDEGYHAYYTQKIAIQIREFYRVKEDDISLIVGNYYEKIDNITNKYGTDYKDLCMLAFVIAGENQIVGDISEQMKAIVYEPIRAMFRDHMKDEVFHAHFFSKIFGQIWPQLNLKEKEIMGLAFCDSMEILGRPRTDIYYYSLSRLQFDHESIANYIEDIYNTREWKTINVAKRMIPTINLLKDNNVFQVGLVRDAFLDKSYI